MRTVFLFPILLLASCGDWPDLGDEPVRTNNQEWPTLLPLDDVLSRSTSETDIQTEADALAARAEQLRARAALLRTPVPDEAAFEAMRARLAQ